MSTSPRPSAPARAGAHHPRRTLILILAGALVGAAAALASVALNLALEAAGAGLEGLRGHWWAVSLPAAGATLSWLVWHRVFRATGCHGVPEVIASVRLRKGVLKLRSIGAGLICSLLTIASGGSAGPEAPVVVSGAAMGSNLARLSGLGGRSRSTLVGCGAAGAISAIFNAPVTGLIFALEIVMGEWTSFNMIPIAISAVTATEVSRLLIGNRIPFDISELGLGTLDLGAAVGLAAAAALLSIALSRSVRLVEERSGAWLSPGWLRAGVGGLLVGLIGLGMPLALGEGYTTIRAVIHGQLDLGLTLVALAFAAKLLATALTMGSGGAGGIFAPCLVLGALTGLWYHDTLQALWPGAGLAGAESYALMGMAGLVGGTMQAPLTGVFLAVEITGGYEIMVAVVLVSAISSTLCRYAETGSFYLRELVESGQLLRPRTDASLMAVLQLTEVLETDTPRVGPDETLAEIVEQLRDQRATHLCVVEPTADRFLGLVDITAVRDVLFHPDHAHRAARELLLDPPAPVVSPTAGLAGVMAQMESAGSTIVAVVEKGRLRGVIGRAQLLERYRRRLIEESEGEELES